MANSIEQTTDGGYIIAGNSSSSDGDVSGNRNSQDFWIIKLAPDCRSTDSLALVALYDATNGSSWSNPWNRNLPITEWDGIFF